MADAERFDRLESLIGTMSTDVQTSITGVQASLTTLTTRVVALEENTGRGSPATSEQRIAALEVSTLEHSRNNNTARSAAAINQLQKQPFKTSKSGQKLEYWLQHVRQVLTHNKVDDSEWGTALLSALDTQPQQQVYAQLDRRGDAADFSFEAVVAILTELFGSRSTVEDSLDKLRALELTSVLPEGLSKYQSEFLDLSASVSVEVLSGRARCMLIEAQLPDPVRIGLSIMIGQGGEAFTEPAKLFDYARQAMAQVPEMCQKWFDERKVKLGKRPASFAEAVSRPAKTTRTTTATQPSRTGKPGLPKVDGKSADEVKRLADKDPKACFECGSHKHRYVDCPNRQAQNATDMPGLAACLTESADSDDQSLQCAALTMPDAGCDQSSMMPGHIWKRCAKLTKPFDMLVGCNATDHDLPALTYDKFLETLHEGHAFINASRC